MNRYLCLLRGAAALVFATLACSAGAEVVTLRLIGINDFHGHLEPGNNAISVPDPDDDATTIALRSGGGAHLATLIRQLRDEQPRSVFVSAGDLTGASPLASALFHDEPTVELMNLLGLAVNAVGNHEFDHGAEELLRLARGGCAPAPRGVAQTCAHESRRYAGSRFAMLASNVADGDGKSLLAPSHVVEVDGLRVGFIGAVTRSTPGIVMPGGIRGWRFLDEAAAINAAAAELHRRGVNTMVAVIHEGGEADGGINGCERPRGPIFEIAARLDARITVVFSGHTHRAYNCRGDARVVIQGGSFGRLVSVVDLAIDRGSGALVRAPQTRNVPVPNGLDADPRLRKRYPPLPPDRAAAALIDHYRRLAEPLAQRSAGTISAPFDRRRDGGDHAAGRLIADAQLAATRSAGAQAALTNPGGVRTDLIGRAPDGRVTYADVFAMQPFGNALVTLTLTGHQLRRLLESQWSRGEPPQVRFLQPSRTLTYTWHASRPHGDRVDPESLRIEGRRVEDDARYRITVNSYLAEGGDGFRILTEGTDRTGGPLDADALADYLRRESAQTPLAPDPHPRVRRAP